MSDQSRRLLIISNRLPVSMTRDATGEWSYVMSSGGLVSALSGLKKEMEFTWIGWPGKQAEEWVFRRCFPGPFLIHHSPYPHPPLSLYFSP